MNKRLYVDDWEKLKVIKDGDSYAVVAPDFENLQTSEVYWFSPGQDYFGVIDAWYQVSSAPIAHLPVLKIAEIIGVLNGKREE